MSVASQSAGKAQNPYRSASVIACVASILLLAGLLRALGVSLVTPALVFGVAALLWTAFRHPTFCLGATLAFMPIYPLAILLGKFFGPPFMMSDVVTACDRIVLLLITCVLWWRNGIKFKTPDWILLACFGLAVVRLAFGGMLMALLRDFNFMIAYAAGRVAVLTATQEQTWARRAVWIVAILAMLGLTEVFIIGEVPRGMLYSSVAEGATDGGALNAAFHGEGFTGLRESATMFGPLQFAPLCMAALIVWWVYRRNPWPGGMIAVGLICTVTRSAWLGTALAIPLLAVATRQKKRFLLYATLALALFIALIPVVGLGDYLFATRKGQDPSAQGHQESIVMGMNYALDHPLGSGPGNAGMYDFKNNRNSVWIENTYLTLAAEYGIATSLCFVGFLVSALWVAWRERTRLGYAAIGILVGFGTVMFIMPAHDVFSLATWIWFPVGLAVRFSGSASGSWLPRKAAA